MILSPLIFIKAFANDLVFNNLVSNNLVSISGILYRKYIAASKKQELPIFFNTLAGAFDFIGVAAGVVVGIAEVVGAGVVAAGVAAGVGAGVGSGVVGAIGA